jgi:hypothetical protein
MNRIVSEIKIKHELSNTSEHFLLVGNCDEIISAHESASEANDALKSLPNPTAKWTDVQIVAPGQTVSGTYLAPVTVPDSRPFDWSAFTVSE